MLHHRDPRVRRKFNEPEKKRDNNSQLMKSLADDSERPERVSYDSRSVVFNYLIVVSLKSSVTLNGS